MPRERFPAPDAESWPTCELQGRVLTSNDLPLGDLKPRPAWSVHSMGGTGGPWLSTERQDPAGNGPARGRPVTVGPQGLLWFP